MEPRGGVEGGVYDEEQTGGNMRIVLPDDHTNIISQSPLLEKLRGLGEVEVFDTPVRDEAEAIHRLQGAQIALTIRERSPLTRTVLEALPDLRLLAMTGTGFGNLDLEAATELGIVVTRTPTLAVRTVAELTLGLMIGLLRRIPQADAAIRRGEWPSITGVELQGKTLGIVGLGRIGGMVARIAAAFAMKVIAWDPVLTPEQVNAAGATYVPLDDLMQTADIVTIHLRLAPKTRGAIGARNIARMKPTSFLINAARAAITDEEALVTALRERRIAGAALDVFMREPLPVDSPLLGLDNVVLTPHIGWTTAEVHQRFASSAVGNVENYLAGTPTNMLNPQVWERRRT